MDVARGRLLWMLIRPAPNPIAGGPKKCCAEHKLKKGGFFQPWTHVLSSHSNIL